MSCEDLILRQEKDGLLWLTLNRPQRLNAVIADLYAQLCQELDAAAQSDSVRVIILTGAGRAFCVGADMKAHAEGQRTAFQKREYLRLEQEVCRRLFEHPKPVIAAVNGYALGAGAEMALAADFLLMRSSAIWGLPETSIGAFVGGGVSWLLPQRVGMTQARELLLLGRQLDGHQALQLGLAHRCYEVESPEDFELEVESFAADLAKKAPLALSLAKQQLNRSAQQHFNDALTAELEGMMFCSSTQDWQEGVRAFSEKRDPQFSGR
ncbi:enoyl-CoA hydratase/isomerase family protein [Marinospirillum perlucidum]|uniref:enoyl-CoA hydratase/isomerase family protein n=1 Tax=Marinospirillum perlucidum TaxID=1982602 RepID=UPI000DF48039|nr:enoyl-CoA hydratase/isomerase family protein [Marinospirillum perlucidum]